MPPRRRRAAKIEIVFETHSTTTDNERWIASGWLDGQLSTLGRRQAKELGDRRADDEDLVAVNGTAVARLEVERTKHVLDPYPGGESYLDVVARVRSFLHDLPPRFQDQRIVVVGHSATKWALDHLLEGTPLEELVEDSFRWQPGWLYTLAIDA
jgi:broad specificity phosphatase PhoE